MSVSTILQLLVATDLLFCSCDAHNALADVQVLHQLTTKLLNTKLLVKHSFTVPWVKEHNTFLQQKKENLTFQLLIQEKALSTGMAEKAASSGLSVHHLELAFQRNGTDGLLNILKEKFSGKPRVTSNTRILSQICTFFESRKEE